MVDGDGDGDGMETWDIGMGWGNKKLEWDCHGMQRKEAGRGEREEECGEDENRKRRETRGGWGRGTDSVFRSSVYLQQVVAHAGEDFGCVDGLQQRGVHHESHIPARHTSIKG